MKIVKIFCEKLFGIPENLSVIDEARAGYVEDTSIVISREQLEKYFAFVKEKIKNYFETLSAVNDLLNEPIKNGTSMLLQFP